MKKIIYSITFLLLSIVFINSVHASTFSMSLIGDNSFENEITLNLQVSNLTEFESGLYGLTGYLNYDSEKIELTSITASNGFDLTYGESSKKIVLYKPTGVEQGTNILTIKFKNKTLIKDETTNITVTNLLASDGDKDIQGTNISKTIKLTVKEDTTDKDESTDKEDDSNTNTDNTTNNNTDNTTNNNTNNNNNNITSKPNTNNSTNNNTTTNKKEEKSTNNYLSSITLSNGTIDFDKNTLLYDIIVPYEVDTIKIDATTEHEKATITGTGKQQLSVGTNKIELVVKAEDETERKYTINVSREKENIVVEEDNTQNITKESEKKDNDNHIYLIVISIISVILLVTSAIFMYKNKQR